MNFFSLFLKKLIILIICIGFFLLYLLINTSISNNKQLEKKHDQHQINEVRSDGIEKIQQNGHHRYRINDIESKGIEKDKHTSKNYNQNKNVLRHSKSLPALELLSREQPREFQLNKNDMIKDSIIHINKYGICPIQTELFAEPDIQMLNLYAQILFNNYESGSWKKKWVIDQDAFKFNKHHKLKVFVVPHSHNDPGWIKTFDDYYEHDTKQILFNALRHLTENPTMKFIWAEISYFSRFYDSLNNKSKDKIKKLVKNGQLEFVTGGWVMPDEANSHWYSLLIQLTEGHLWLKQRLNVTPKSSWAIDPFGHSSSMPYILKKSGFENLLIQRTHYKVKEYLAAEMKLEFRWRQSWEGSGETELFTHMMPFSSYDIPHTCGPDPTVCSKFDFKFDMEAINNLNTANMANLIVDQWRKKSVLYKTRSVLIPLGNDFRYSQSEEWEAQRTNYEKLFDYINNKPSLYTEAKFATLQEYFDSVRNEKDLSEFPTLSGDFFTYADRDDHYWSGYYTSRPFHKRMDRVLLHYVRSAEMLRAWHNWSPESKLDDKLEYARQQLSLFQHHDGITGTARNDVVKDYYLRMEEAIKNCKFVMQQTAYRLLTKPKNYQPNFEYQYFYIDDERWPGLEDNRMLIILGDELPYKHLVIQNSFTQWREEVVEFYISTPFVRVENFDGKKVSAQISPLWSWLKGAYNIPRPSTTKFRLLINIRVPPLGLATYIVIYNKDSKKKSSIFYSKNTILTKEPFTADLGDYPSQLHFAEPHEFNLTHGDGSIIYFNINGSLKSISYNQNSDHKVIRLEFFQYNTHRSGAYLFLPHNPAIQIQADSPIILLTQGELESSVVVGLPFGTHSIILRYNSAIEIQNLVDISKMDNTELVLRISSGIYNNDIFYTDLNALQIVKRKRLSTIPLQANYYPVPSSIYIEDTLNRLTILSAQPLGGSSLNNGEIEIMQDRRLMNDDDLGLGQGVTDNKSVQLIFRLLFESLEPCTKRDSDYPNGFLTATAYTELQRLMIPLNKLIWNENVWVGAMSDFGTLHEPLEDGMEVTVIRNLDTGKNLNNSEIGIVIHRTFLEECSTDANRDGKFNIRRLLSLEQKPEIYSSQITLLTPLKKLSEVVMNICPMDTNGFIIKR